MNDTTAGAELAELLTDAEPLCGEGEFDDEIHAMVRDDAPRRFAVVQVLGERVDARIAAWGLAFEDRVEVVHVQGAVRMSLRTPERALFAFRGPQISTKIVWVDQ